MGSERGGHYAIHFFDYSALAAIPFKILDGLGTPPFKAFQFVNMAALTILVLALYRFSGTVRRTVFATPALPPVRRPAVCELVQPEFMTASKGAHGWRPTVCTLGPQGVKMHMRTDHSKG